MSPLRSAFIERLHLKGFSERTVSNYVQAVERLSRYYKQSPLTIADEQIRSFLVYLRKERKLAPATINLQMDGLKTFFKLMAPESTHMVGINHMKAPKHIPLVLSRSEINKIIEATDNLKHKTVLMLLYSSGIRLSECASLKPYHIESTRMKIRVEQGKGMKDRYTILARKTLDTLRLYYKAYHPKQWLFEGKNGKHFSTRMIEKIVTVAATKAKIDKKVHAHTLRHCFATHLLEAGISLPVIQNLLGHNNIKTTMIYLHVGQPMMDSIISPLDFSDSHMGGKHE